MSALETPQIQHWLLLEMNADPQTNKTQLSLLGETPFGGPVWLVSFWQLEESSASRPQLSGQHHLTSPNRLLAASRLSEFSSQRDLSPQRAARNWHQLLTNTHAQKQGKQALQLLATSEQPTSWQRLSTPVNKANTKTNIYTNHKTKRRSQHAHTHTNIFS